MLRRTYPLLLLTLLPALTGPAPRAAQTRTGADGSVSVHIDASEPNAVLALLRARRDGRPPSAGAWKRLFATAGYRALARREAAMGRPLTNDAIRAYVASDSLLARAPALDRTVAAWTRMDLTAAARRALAYLPKGTPLRATIFLEIKPYPNSFVFDLDGTRAIYLYVNPLKTRAQVENVVAHELHHTGVAAACAAPDDSAGPAPLRVALEWMTAFGEGRAMLAAAGGPEVHPHALDDSATRARWDRDVSHVNTDLERLQAFFLDILDRKIPADSARTTGYSFFGVQGPWYTVGWQMAVTVERAFGRARLVATTCDPVAFLQAYNDAVARSDASKRLARWDPDFLARLRRR